MKKPTVIRFIGIHTVVFFAVMLIGMCLLFSYTIDRAKNDAARQTVARESRRVSRHIVKLDDGKLGIDPDMMAEVEDCSIAVVDEQGGIISGSLPKELSEETLAAPVRIRFQKVKTNGKTYYVYDNDAMDFHREPGEDREGRDNSEGPDNGRKASEGGSSREGTKNDGRREDGKSPELRGIYIRAVLCADDLRTVYNDIHKFFYSFVTLLMFIGVLGGSWLYKKAACPVSEMCDDIKKLAGDPDYSHRIENTTLFYETEVMTEAYNKLMDRNEKLINRQEEFNENVSHELRTPVAVIRSEVELLEDMYGDSLPAEAEEALSVIHKQSDRINAMLTELKYMAKMDRENFALNKEAMELSDIAESVCEDIEDVTLQGRKFVYHWEHSEAEIDVSLVMIAVRNIITNAVRYSPEGSTIDLYSGIDGDMAYLRVSDQGIGIPEEDLEKIFDLYYQVNAERNSDGFGLGLALTMKIAVKHGGTVLVESEQGKGSTFTLLLPVK